jgi:hypothetical protein
MKNKSRKTPRKGTLVEFELVEITDPAEQAEFDRRCRDAEKAFARAEARKAKPRKRK